MNKRERTLLEKAYVSVNENVNIQHYIERVNSLDLSQVSEEVDKLVQEVLGDAIFDDNIDTTHIAKIVKEFIKKKL